MRKETAIEKEERIFNFYKKDLEKLAGVNKQVRFLCVEYVCSFPKIDSIKMGKAILKDGFKIVFDDSSISEKENKRKKNAVMEGRK